MNFAQRMALRTALGTALARVGLRSDDEHIPSSSLCQGCKRLTQPPSLSPVVGDVSHVNKKHPGFA